MFFSCPTSLQSYMFQIHCSFSNRFRFRSRETQRAHSMELEVYKTYWYYLLTFSQERLPLSLFCLVFFPVVKLRNVKADNLIFFFILVTLWYWIYVWPAERQKRLDFFVPFYFLSWCLRFSRKYFISLRS